MNKEFIFSLSKQVMELAQDNGISPKQLKTYAGVMAVAAGVLVTAINSPATSISPLNTSPFKPTIEQSAQARMAKSPVNLDDMKAFLNGNGDAMVYDNPFANGEAITLVHSDNYKTLANLGDPDYWAAKVAVKEQINNQTQSHTYCDNGVDWDKPVVSLSGNCFSLINLTQADLIHASVPAKASLTNDDVRLFVLLHETAHGQSTSRALSALHKLTETDSFRNNFTEKLADVSAFIGISNSLSKQNMNTLFDTIIELRSKNSHKDATYNTHGLLAVTQKLYNEDPEFFKGTKKQDVLYKSSLLAKTYNDTENKAVFFPNYQSKTVLPASFDGIINRLQSRISSGAKDNLLKAIGLDKYSVHKLDKGELTDIVMEHADKVTAIIEHSRTKNIFDNLVNANIDQVSLHLDTKEFMRSFNKLAGLELDTPKGHVEAIIKAQSRPVSMDPH